MTDIYTAILKAADHIETHPERYEFRCNFMPESDRDIGCMAAWTLYFAGYRGKNPHSLRYYLRAVFGWHSVMVLTNMGYFANGNRYKFPDVSCDASQAAEWMRHWAQRYRPLPASVMAIFTETASV